MLELKNVTYKANGQVILDNVSLNVKACETKVILGPSGAGKSSILKIVLRLWRPQTGAVYVNGVDITHLTERELIPIRRRMAMVFQGNALFDSLTVEENVGYFLAKHESMKQSEVQARVKECLQFVNLEGTNRLTVEELSGGMRKRVAIARAIASHPDAILYDEPTTGLDPLNAKTITGLIVRLRDERCITSIVVTHMLQDALMVADSIAFINAGKLVTDGPVDKLLECPNPLVRDFMAGLYSEARMVAGQSPSLQGHDFRL
jgi:phospholipid/cholesterol/gamma-HCH transport system ATP-binding protein